eukprot:gene23023-31335_t
MAARANLTLDDTLKAAFISAQESRLIRIINVQIVAEVLTLHSTIQRVSTARHDFDLVLAPSLASNEAIFVLFCTTEEVAAANTLDWLFLSWVPDGCRVRDKMLYSSSKEDLKRNLGAGYFKTEYAANVIADVTWDSYLASLERGLDLDLLTETEKLVLEEKTLTQTESHKTKSTAMNVLPFQVSPELEEKLLEFRDGLCNWVDMKVVTEDVPVETIILVDHRKLEDFNSLLQYVSKDEARFIVMKVPTFLRSDASSLFIFSCPESVPIRMKMTMSSCKSSVIAAAQRLGLTFEKTIEIRSAEDIDEAVSAGISASISSSNSFDSAGPSSAGANLTHTKPQRPGRNTIRNRVSKFTEEV